LGASNSLSPQLEKEIVTLLIPYQKMGFVTPVESRRERLKIRRPIVSTMF